MLRLNAIWLIALLASPGDSVRAAVAPNKLFADGAVLQQGMPVPVWGTAADGEEVTVSCQEQSVSTVARHGRWIVRLEPLRAGGPFDMTVAGTNRIELKNILVGEVWLCSGQSNAAFRLQSTINAPKTLQRSANSMLRIYSVPDAEGYRQKGYAPFPDQVNGQWLEAGPNTLGTFSAVGYFFGRDLQRSLNRPVGIIKSTVGDSVVEEWTRREIVEPNGPVDTGMNATAARRYKRGAFYEAGRLYTLQIAPVIPYAIRGVIWYQGESSAGNDYEAELRHRTEQGIVTRGGFEYRDTFPRMIKNWRDDWGQGNFPFLFVQVAPFFRHQPGAIYPPAIPREPDDSVWAELRESQLLTSQRVPNTGMAVSIDLGDPNDIHPANKEPVGARLALLARSRAYGEKLVDSGPRYKSMEIRGDRIAIRFDPIGTGRGLVAKGNELRGFTIAGEDRNFKNAEARIDGDTVIVRSAKVAHPAAVRYGWANYPLVSLYNRAGLPASPFRTDTWHVLTGP